jgi:hypothetical protein
LASLSSKPRLIFKGAAAVRAAEQHEVGVKLSGRDLAEVGNTLVAHQPPEAQPADQQAEAGLRDSQFLPTALWDPLHATRTRTYPGERVAR